MKIGYLMQAGVPDIRMNPPTGPANHVRQVFNHLRGLGHTIRLVAYMDGQIWKSDDLQSFEPVHLKGFDNYFFRKFESVIRRVQHELQLPYAAFFESLRFLQACRQELTDYDVLYERMGWVGYGGGLAARWLQIPLVLEVNGDPISELKIQGMAPKGAQRWLSTILMQMAIAQAFRVITSGDGWRRRFIDRWKIEPGKVITIENGSEMVSLLSRDQLRSFHMSENIADKTTIIYIGAFEPWQGGTILVKAFASAIDKGAHAKLIMVGEGKEKDLITTLINDLQIRENVTLTGYLTIAEIAIQLTYADIGVAPYCNWGEYSGLKLLDYKSAGLAIIASGEKGQPAIIKHGQTGWIVAPCDEAALCEAIIYLANHVDIRRQMGRQARMEAEQCHSWRHTVEKVETILHQVVEK